MRECRDDTEEYEVTVMVDMVREECDTVMVSQCDTEYTEECDEARCQEPRVDQCQMVMMEGNGVSLTRLRDRTESQLTIAAATPGDQGNFTCSPSNTRQATVNIFVTRGQSLSLFLCI